MVGHVGECDELTVVMEPTRNVWVPVAAHFLAVGARVVLVPAERSADLRRYYAKHTKNDRLDSHVLARLPLLQRYHQILWMGSGG
jgi:transposase